MVSERTHKRFEHLGIGTTIGAAVGVLLLAIALFEGWINIRGVSSETKDSSETGVAITFDSKEFSEDVKQAEQTVNAVAELETSKGRISSLDAENRIMTLETDGDGAVTVYVEEDTDFLSHDNEKLSLDAFSTKDEVAIVYKTNQDNKNIAQKVTKLQSATP